MTPEVRRKYIKKAMERKKKKDDLLYGKPERITASDYKAGYRGTPSALMQRLSKMPVGGRAVAKLLAKRKKERDLAYSKSIGAM